MKIMASSEIESQLYLGQQRILSFNYLSLKAKQNSDCLKRQL
ncbi:unnamed protein product [Paramecium sonneborni]|uniref:Uncharacterized protein n=1 Tax=Paramecium sonneborni TaxID=65129 RepID=A0A8S1RLH5_9CILI|nr:unnamed protein product [Paramecium sonneborni]